MSNKNKPTPPSTIYHLPSTNSAFTIVELLVVIVVIGILAAITIVSYTGISKKATISIIESDLANASKQIKMFQVNSPTEDYPTAINCNNPTSTQICIRTSGNNSIGPASGYIVNNGSRPKSFSVIINNGSTAYYTTDDLAPTVSTTLIKAWGGTNYDYSRSIAQSNDGGYVIAGQTNSYGAGGYDIKLIKYDNSGNLQWNKTWGGAGSDNSSSVIQTADGNYLLTGSTASYGAGGSDLLLAKYDSNGNLLWNKTWGGAGSDGGKSIIQANDGGYVVTGQTNSYGVGSYDILLIKYDSNGNLLWNKTWGGAGGSDMSNCVIKSSDGGYVVVGDSYGTNTNMVLIKYDSDGNLLWDKTWGGTGSEYSNSVIQSIDGGYVVTGQTDSYGSGLYDMLTVKYDSSGNLLWNKTWGGTGSDSALSIVESIDGGYVATGQTASYGAGGSDLILVKYDSDGNLLWNKTWGGTGSETGWSITRTMDGGYAVAGQTNSHGQGLYDTIIVKYNIDGEIVNCPLSICTSPTAATTSPTAVIASPTLTVTNPTATINNPTATVTSPTATNTIVVAPQY